MGQISEDDVVELPGEPMWRTTGDGQRQEGPKISDRSGANAAVAGESGASRREPGSELVETRSVTGSWGMSRARGGEGWVWEKSRGMTLMPSMST